MTLLGAEFTYCLGIYREDWRLALEERGEAFLRGLRLLRLLRRAQQTGITLSTHELARQLPSANEEEIDQTLQILQEARLVRQADDKCWLLARDLGEVTLSEYYQSAPYVLPPPELVSAEPAALRLLVGQLEQDLRAHMDQPLAILLAEE